MSEVIKETQDYMLVIGKTAHHADTPDMDMYQCVNRITDVIELETSALPRALSMIDSLQEDLDNVRKGIPYGVPFEADEELTLLSNEEQIVKLDS